MSGGSMNYAYCSINGVANQVQEVLANYLLRRSKGFRFMPSECDQERYPNAEYLKTPEALTNETVRLMQYSLETIRKAAICAERIEWLTSGDDDESSFCARLNEALQECEKTGGVE